MARSREGSFERRMCRIFLEMNGPNPYCTQVFNRILAPYIENLDMNQVNYGIGQGQSWPKSYHKGCLLTGPSRTDWFTKVEAEEGCS